VRFRGCFGQCFDQGSDQSASTPSNWTAPVIANKATSGTCTSLVPTSTRGRKFHDVVVGAAGALQFDPIEIKADIGEIIRFDFLALNHTLTQSSLSHPCVWSGGFSTGFNQFNPENVEGRHIVEYEVKSIDAQWFYCAQNSKKSHCQAGMVFSLNPGDRLEDFVAAATHSSKTTCTSYSHSATLGVEPTTSSNLLATSTSLSVAPTSTSSVAGVKRICKVDGVIAMIVGWAIVTF